MNYEKIVEFYHGAVLENKFSQSLLLEFKNISTESELKKFIEQKLLPIAKNMGYNFSVEELLEYEKYASKLLSEEDLEQISGGANLKTWILGGALSLTAILGTGFTLNTASAESATPTSDSAFTQITQYVSTDETFHNDGSTSDLADTTAETPSDDITSSSSTYTTTTDQDDLSTPDVADTAAETPSDDITSSSSTYTATTDQDGLSTPDAANTTAETSSDDITSSSSTYTATTDQDDLSTSVTDTTEQITTEVQADDTNQQIAVSEKGTLSCEKNYDGNWSLAFKEDGYTETESCKFSAGIDFKLNEFFRDASATFAKTNTVSLTDLVSSDQSLTLTGISVRKEKEALSCDKNDDGNWKLSLNEDYTEKESCTFSAPEDFDLKKFFSEASATFTKTNTISLADLVSSDPSLTLKEFSVRNEKRTLSCNKNYDGDWSLAFKEDGYTETEACKFSANDDFDFKQFFSEASEQFSSTDTFSVKDFVSSNPNLTFKEISLKEKGTLSCYKNDNGDWSLTFKKDYYTDPESCTFSADDDFDLKNFFSAAVNKFCSEESFSVKDFARSNPILKLKLSNEEMKKIETEFGLKILEDLPTGDKTDLEKFLELPQKADLSGHEQEIYDEIEVLVKRLTEEAKKDTSDISDQLKIAKAIYEWVANNITYIDKKQESAFEVFENKCGICRGYSHLTNLMMRIAGIPSLYIGSLNSNTDGNGHAFSAVYISDDTPERSGWTVLDSTWAAPKFTDGICEQNLFEKNESDSVHILNDKFNDLTNAANKNIPWGYEAEITDLLKSKTDIIEKNNIDQINEELSKQLFEINSKPEYGDINKLSEIKIQISPDDKATSEETKDHFLSRLKLITTLSEDAKKFITQKNQEKLQKYFSTAYDHDITCKDANEKILSKEVHSIQSLSTEIYDIDLSKSIHPHETETGLVYSLSEHEEDVSILLFGNPNMEPLENVEIPEEILSYGLSIRIGSGIKSLILHGDEKIDITNNSNLDSIDTTDSNKYVAIDGNLYVKNPDGSQGKLIRIFRKNGKVGNISYYLQLSNNGKEVETISISGDSKDILENVTLPSEITNYNVPIQIGGGIKSLILHGDEEIDITNAWHLENIDTTNSNKYIAADGKLYVKNPNGSLGEFIRIFRTNGKVGNISYYLQLSDNGKEVETIGISSNGNAILENITLPSEITDYNVPISIGRGIKSLVLHGDEEIDILAATHLESIDTTDSKKYIAEGGVLYEKAPNGTKGSQIAIFNQEVDKGTFKYVIKPFNTIVICGKTPAEPLKDFRIPSDLSKQYDIINVGPNIESLALTGKEEVDFEKAAHLKELDISESDIYVIHEGKLGHKQDEYSPYEIPLPDGVKIIDKK